MTGTGDTAAGDVGLDVQHLLGPFRGLPGPARQDGGDVVEVLTSREAVTRYADLQRSASEELLRFDTPPYSADPGDVAPELDRLAAGVRYRVIYSDDALALPGRAAAMDRLVAGGEQARALPVLPAKLAIADRRTALVPLDADDPTAAAVVVHGPALVGLLVVAFEELWRRAAPVSAATHDINPTSRRILTMLAAGAKDETIARHLGVTERTVRRHVRVILSRLGAKTRLEAALHARDRGWI